MNKAFEYNGTIVSKSNPTAKLTTLRRVVHLDSGDRDFNQYPTNGDMVLYLPRTYERVVGISVKGAEIPPIASFWSHNYGSTGATGANDVPVSTSGLYYILLDSENLNRADETSPRHKRSTFIDNVFAKFQLPATLTEPILYNESSSMQNETHYTPPIAKLDRLNIVLRTHLQNTTPGFIYSSGWRAGSLEYGLTLEIETLENSFDDYSSVETRVSERNGGFWNSSSQ